MTSSTIQESKSRLLPGRNPPPGEDPVADAIRERRGARGITPLDANLLHFPAGAAGYNQLLGALRDKGKLEPDLRELIMLRIAALNNAAYEWIQHEPIGRKAGLTTGQLYAIRDVETPLPPLAEPTAAVGHAIFSPLLLAALHLTDALTLASLPHSSPLSSYAHPSKPQAHVLGVCLQFKEQLQLWTSAKIGNGQSSSVVDDLYAEATMVIGTYNLVSRFLVGSDVNGLGDAEVPWPVDRVVQLVEVPSYPGQEGKISHQLYTIMLKHHQSKDDEEDIPWLVLCNSLLTSTRMWGWVVPYLLEGGVPSMKSPRRYNILLHDQRGHGLSTLPSSPPSATETDARYDEDDASRLATIPLLAWDIQNILISPSIKNITGFNKPIHAVIGVSQGAACALAFGAIYPFKGQTNTGHRTTKAIIACDTGPRTAPGNRDAWKERVDLAIGSTILRPDSKKEVKLEYGERVGLENLSAVTVPRWFPDGSPLSPAAQGVVEEMVKATPIQGFIEGARALGGYDLLAPAAEGDLLDLQGRPSLFHSDVHKVLLLAGGLDGNGKVAQGLENLNKSWNDARNERFAEKKTGVEFVRILDSGHLPMVDRPAEWAEVVGRFLATV